MMVTKDDYRFTERPSMFSENYIKQCEQAKQIQQLCRYIKGDWFYTKAHGYHVISDDWLYFSDDCKTINWITRAKGVWLPTQEQLQAMLNPKLDPITLLYLIDRFVASGEGIWHSFARAPYPDPTMNELWLAFVMKEKYNKVWTGKDWQISNKG